MTHTKGPWIAEPHGGTTALYSGREDSRHGLRLMNLDDGDSNFAANRRLIEAAPDMLEALEAAVACGLVPKISRATSASLWLPKQLEVADKIRAAIAKAKGAAK